MVFLAYLTASVVAVALCFIDGCCRYAVLPFIAAMIASLLVLWRANRFALSIMLQADAGWDEQQRALLRRFSLWFRYPRAVQALSLSQLLTIAVLGFVAIKSCFSGFWWNLLIVPAFVVAQNFIYQRYDPTSKACDHDESTAKAINSIIDWTNTNIHGLVRDLQQDLRKEIAERKPTRQGS